MSKGKYPLIPMDQITDEAREMSVAWMECEDKNWIGQKHKLASDIMNYAKNLLRKYMKNTLANEDSVFIDWIEYNSDFTPDEVRMLKEIEKEVWNERKNKKHG